MPVSESPPLNTGRPAPAGHSGLAGRGRTSVICPGWPPAGGHPGRRHTGLNRVGAGRVAARTVAPGLETGLPRHGRACVRPARRGRAAAEAQSPGASRGHPRPAADGRRDIPSRRTLHRRWPRPGGAGPGCSCPRNVARRGRWDRGDQASAGRLLVSPVAIPCAAARETQSGHVPPAASAPRATCVPLLPHMCHLSGALYGAFCPFRLRQIGAMWPTQGRVITAGAVRSDLRTAHGPEGSADGHRAGAGRWRRGPGGYRFRHVPVTVGQRG